MSSARGDARRLAVVVPPTAARAPGMRRFETEKPVKPGLGLGAAAGRALVADLAARAGSGAGVGRDRGRVVVRLDLHQDVDRLGRVAVLPGRGVGEEARRDVPSMTAALSLYADEHAARARLGAAA